MGFLIDIEGLIIKINAIPKEHSSSLRRSTSLLISLPSNKNWAAAHPGDARQNNEANLCPSLPSYLSLLCRGESVSFFLIKLDRHRFLPLRGQTPSAVLLKLARSIGHWGLLLSELAGHSRA